MYERLSAIRVASFDLWFPAGHAASIHRCGSLAELRQLLDAMPDSSEPATLDLSAHSSAGHKYLRLGRDRIDLLSPPISRFFAQLARDAVLPRLGVVSVRMLGCGTATTSAGQLTLRRLARMLGISVYGTVRPLSHHHYDVRGFLPVFESLLWKA